MDEDKFKGWEDELKRRRDEKKKHRDPIPLEDREPGPESCSVKRGGLTRFGHPCLMPGKPQYGGGCWRHPAEGYPLENPEPEPEMRRVRPTDNRAERWKILTDMLEEQNLSLEDFVAQLSPEELARGQIKTSAGSFRGAPPKWVPRAFMQACVRELMTRGRRLYQENYEEAVRIMIDLAQSTDVDANVRLRATQFVIERIEGKTPERVVVESKDSFAVRIEELEAQIGENEQLKRVKERLSGSGSTGTAG